MDGRYGTERARTAASGRASREARKMRGGLVGRWVWWGACGAGGERRIGRVAAGAPFPPGCAVLPLRIALRLRVVVV